MEPFRDRTPAAEALDLLYILVGRGGFLTDRRTVRAAEIAARLYLAQELDEAERRIAQSLWTALSEAKRRSALTRREQILLRRVIRQWVAELTDSTKAA